MAIGGIEAKIGLLGRTLILIALLLFLLGLLTWSGVVRCNQVPMWCEVYEVFMGKPKVLIVYGDYGLGDPDLLQKTLRSPSVVGVHAPKLHIDHVNVGNLKEYRLVIVTRAKKVSTKQLKYFTEFVQSGGRLVWSGDAGTVLGKDDNYLYLDERYGESEKHEVIGPWARKQGEDIIAFDALLGVNYETNYCDVKKCGSEQPHVGTLIASVGREHRLIYGIKPGLSMDGDFAIVEPAAEASGTTVLSIDTFSHIIAEDGTDYGDAFPMIVTSGVGERVAYYAAPLETFVKEEREEKYFSLFKNMYYGMTR